MTPPQFPFAALVGLETLKFALQLAAIDHRLSVVVRGDKGAGKSTARPGLAALLAREVSRSSRSRLARPKIACSEALMSRRP